jgi:3'(2'), 5'-bisphosphate nucleotidase
MEPDGDPARPAGDRPVPTDPAADAAGAAGADAELAGRVAALAGRMLVDLRERMGFADPTRLKDAGDLRAHELIARLLLRERPNDVVFSEEAVDDPVRLTAERVWIVDPLDGTREYGQPGRRDWAVHIALWVRGSHAPCSLPAAALGLPARDRVLVTGATRPADRTGGAPRIAVSRSRPAGFLPGVAAELGAELVPIGSAGAKVAAVLTGRVDAYVHAGGQYEWDSAAPVAVALSAGLHASRIDGSPLRYNRPDPRLPDLVVCRPELAGRLLAAIARHR